ncbi:MAG: zinc-ribbon domain-containing protein [Oscillospiraceae bacterium]|nr:zinc-ribbon domain-containing protein [Oscillospiraceae bacterium]
MKLIRRLIHALAVGASALLLMQGAAISASAAPAAATTTTMPATTAAPPQTTRSAEAQVVSVSSEEYLTFLDDTEPMKKYYDEMAARREVYDEETDMTAFFAEAQYKFHDAFGTALTDEIGKGVMITVLIVLILLSLLWACTGHKTYPFFASLLIFLLMNGLSIAELICAATGADTKLFTAVPIWLNTVVFLLSAGLIFFCFKRRRFSAFIMMMTCTLPPVLIAGWFVLRERYVNAYAVWLGYRKTLLSGADAENAEATLAILTVILFAFSIGIAAIISLLGAKFRKPFLMIASSLSCGVFAGYLLSSMISKSSKITVLTCLAMGLLVLGGFLVQLYIGRGFLERKKQPAPSPVGGDDLIQTDGDDALDPFPHSDFAVQPAPFPQPDFGQQPDFAPQPDFAQQSGFPQQPDFGQQPEFAPQPAPFPEQQRTPAPVPEIPAPAPVPVPDLPLPAAPRPAFCTNCGSPLEPDAVFCTNCGLRAGADAPESSAAQIPETEPYEPDPIRDAFTDPFTGEAEKPAPAPAEPAPEAESAERPAANQESRRSREAAGSQQTVRETERTGGPVIHMGGKKPEETGLKLHFEKKEQKTSTGDDVFDKGDF